MVRRATPADLDRILEIERASFGTEAYDRKLFAYYQERCGSLFLVSGPPGRASGYIITCIRGSRPEASAELVSVAVHPLLRKQGAASALLESTLRRLRRRGVSRLHLVVRVGNRPALAFYEKYGFRRVRVVREYYEDGGDGIAMSREILSRKK